MGLHSTGTGANVGCFEIGDTGPQEIVVSGTTPGCNFHTCPDCFITPATVSQDITLQIDDCSTALWTRGLPRDGVWSYTFINTDSTYKLTITDNSGAGATYNVPTNSYVIAYCASSLGTTNRLVFPSTQLPTLEVDSGMILTSGNFDASSSTGTFATSSGTNTLNGNTQISSTNTFTTGTGAVTLAGATTVSDSTGFTVGSAGAGGTSTLYGNVQIGASGNGESVSTNIYGDFAQHDDANGVAGATISTGTGSVDLNGHTTVAQDKNLHMTNPGSGTFQTGEGSVTFNGDGEFPSTQTFTTGSGTITIRGSTTLTNGASLTVGSAGSSGITTLYGNVQIGGNGNSESVATQIYGNFAQGDDPAGSGSSFTTGSGAVQINGDTTLAANKDFTMTTPGTGTFSTGEGDVHFNGNTQIANSKTFTTGAGANVVLNGPTTVGDTYPFSVGATAGNGGTSHFHGATTVGDSTLGTSASFTVYGDVTFADDTDGTTKEFTTGTGQITLSGNVDVSAGKSLIMLTSGGGGQFQTGTGAVSINGPVTVASGNSFTLDNYPPAGGLAIQCSASAGDGYQTYCAATR
jgi:hypothetical protein